MVLLVKECLSKRTRTQNIRVCPIHKLKNNDNKGQMGSLLIGGVGWGGGGVEDGFSEEGANEDPSCAL